MDLRVFQAARHGDTNALHALLEEDPLALQKVALLPFAETPLHVATLAGRTDFVRQLLQQMPTFAWDSNKDGFTPLHIASATGNINIVKDILKVAPDLCLIKDKGGRTPLHYAAIKGRVTVVDELLSNCPQAAWIVTANRETALHLAVLNSQFEAFKMLIEKLGTEDTHQLISLADNFGNTILQLAESMNQLQVLNLLTTNRHHITEDYQDDQTREITNISGITISVENQKSHHQSPPTNSSVSKDNEATLREQQETKNSRRRLVITKGVVPILAGILATSAYRQGLTPPTTIWNEEMKPHDSSCFLNFFQHFSLTESINQCPPTTYYLYISLNTAAFYCALFLVFLHHIPGFLHTLLPASLVSSLLSYLIVLLSIFPDAPTFLVINSVAFLVFGFIGLLKAVVKRFSNCILKHIR